MGSAFKGDPAVKQAVLADLVPLIGSEGILTAPLDGKEKCVEFSELSGLHPAFLFLLRGFVQRIGGAEEREAFVRETLAALPAGANTRDLIVGWYKCLWDGAPNALRDQLAGTSLVEAGDAIIAMQLVAGKQPIARAEWRRARGGVSSSSDLTNAQHDAAAVVAGFAWDLDEVPAAAEDLLQIIQDATLQSINREAQGKWKIAPEAALESVRKIYREAGLKVGPPPERRDSLAMKAYTDALEKAIRDEASQDDLEAWALLRDHNVAVAEAIGNKHREVRAAFAEFLATAD